MAEPGGTQEPGSPSRSPTWLVGTHDLELSPAIFHQETHSRKVDQKQEWDSVWIIQYRLQVSQATLQDNTNLETIPLVWNTYLESIVKDRGIQEGRNALTVTQLPTVQSN